MKSTFVPIICLGLASACTPPDIDDAGGEQQTRVTAGGCACPASGQVASISLDCYCAEFPDACPSYDEATARDASGAVDLCLDDSRWWRMEQEGCGRLTISTGWGTGGGAWSYDARTHQLIGVRGFSDVAFGPCQTEVYEGGSVDTCTEGTVCSLCSDAGQVCADACSLEVRANNGLGLPTYETYEPPSDALFDCQSLTETQQRPALHLGCGHVSVVTSFGTNTFKFGTHEVLRATSVGDKECPNGWGEPASVCADETVCSLCQGDPDVCTAEQLRAD